MLMKEMQTLINASKTRCTETANKVLPLNSVVVAKLPSSDSLVVLMATWDHGQGRGRICRELKCNSTQVKLQSGHSLEGSHFDSPACRVLHFSLERIPSDYAHNGFNFRFCHDSMPHVIRRDLHLNPKPVAVPLKLMDNCQSRMGVCLTLNKTQPKPPVFRKSNAKACTNVISLRLGTVNTSTSFCAYLLRRRSVGNTHGVLEDCSVATHFAGSPSDISRSACSLSCLKFEIEPLLCAFIHFTRILVSRDLYSQK